MDITKILKFFPLMPTKKDTGKLILAIVFYMVVQAVVGYISILLAFTIVLPFILFFVSVAYMYFGIVCAILSYMGKDLNEVFAKKKGGNK